MKKKNKGKKKFVDFEPEEYLKKQNNISCSKQNKDDKNININTNKKQKLTFKNSVERLMFYFPNFSREIIEDVYYENDENFSRTKDKLRELSEVENNENKKDENKMEIEEEQNTTKKKSNKKKGFQDISEYSNFEIVDKNDPIGLDEEIEAHEISDEENENKNKKKKNNNEEFTHYNKLLSIKQKNANQYFSIFEQDNNDNNNNIINTPTPKDETLIDNYLFDQNIEFLCDCFPNYKQEEIVQKICDFDFDINKVVSNLLNEIYQNNTKEGELNRLDDKDINDILANFENIEDFNINDDFLEIQKTIENSIKTENINIKNNIYDEEDYKTKKNNEEEDEEFFLNKKIDDIQNPQIKKDLKQLLFDFPSEEESIIKLAYYSFMNYKLTYDHFNSKDKTKNLGLKNLINSKPIYKESIPKKKKIISKKNNLKSEVEKRRYDTLKNILENKPVNWKIEQEKNINEKDFIAIRNRLFREAQNFFANKNYSKGQFLLSKAKRYQQEIEQIARNRGISQFFNNNSYNNNSREIDLHGLRVEESKMIINKKIEQLRNKKEDQNLKSISFTIITGTGSHSVGHKPVLFPELLPWLKNKNKISAKGKIDEGAIYVTIY